MKSPFRKLPLAARNDPKQADPNHAEQRRKALKDLGKYALYTAPALVALLKSGRAAASGPV